MKKILLCAAIFALSACDKTNLQAVSGLELSDSSPEALSSVAEELSSAALSSSSLALSSSEERLSCSSSLALSSSSSQAVSSSSKVSSSSHKASSSSKAQSSSSQSVQILGTCAPKQDTILQGRSTTWLFSQSSSEDLSNLKFKWILDGSYQETGSGKGKTSVSAEYPKAGTFIAKLSIAGGDTLECAPLVVRLPELSGCRCEPNALSATDGQRVTWTISNCQGEDGGVSDVKWSSDVEGTWLSASSTFSAGMSITPSAELKNGAGYTITVTCPTVSFHDSI